MSSRRCTEEGTRRATVSDATAYGATFYRERAAHCRTLAEAARDVFTISQLARLAEEFEEEAIELEGGTPPGAESP